VFSTTLIFTEHIPLEPAINKYLNGITRNYQRCINTIARFYISIRYIYGAFFINGNLSLYVNNAIFALRAYRARSQMFDWRYLIIHRIIHYVCSSAARGNLWERIRFPEGAVSINRRAGISSFTWSRRYM
jgi:hypothetical protein